MVIATYCESNEALRNAGRLIRSLRTFGGACRDHPVWICRPETAETTPPELLKALTDQHARLLETPLPADLSWLFYAGKPFAGAECEARAEARGDQLLWMDDDTIVLNDPSECDLPDEIDFACCPVMHNRAGSLAANPPDPFWSAIYELLQLRPDQLFTMTTPADRRKIRAYFHCGLIALRPEKRVFRQWAEDFRKLVTDPYIEQMCRIDRVKRVFLHQHALTGAVLHKIDPARLRLFSESYNYPLFFDRQYGAMKAYTSLRGVVTLRIVVALAEIGEDWFEQISGPADRIAWLEKHVDLTEEAI